MPSPAFSSESGLESDAHLHISSSCASSGGGGGGSVPSGAAGRILFSLPGGLAHHYNALQASMSSGDNFIQGGRNLSLAPGHGMLPLPSRVVHEGRVWTSFQVMPSASSMGQPSGVSVQGSQARHGDNSKTMEAANPGAMEEHGSNNEHGGASFAEHDYMSDVSSAPNEDSNKCGERGVGDGGKGCDDAQDTDSNLNLRETELRLGPPESSSSVAGEHNKSAAAALLSGAKRGFSEAIGGSSEPKRSLSEVAAVAAESKRGFQQESGSGHASAEQKLSAARNGGYTEAMINFQASFADVRSSYLDSRPGCLFDHQNGDGKGGSQQQQHQQHVNNRQQQQQHVTPSGFRVPSLPPPWQALDQSAASLGPFPSPKAAMEVSAMGKPPAEAPVVGWPPVRAFRKSTLSSPTPASTKSATDGLSAAAAAAAAGTPAPPATPTASAVVPSAQARPVLEGMTKVMRPTPLVAAAAGDNGCRANGAPASSPNAVTSNYWFVKVYMDGVPFGRKVDLRIHGCYDKLSVGLEEMFTRYANVEQGSNGESKPLKFLQGSDYVLTYEDQDGDLMLVGDVPWNMFITSVKRLRIMKSSEAVGIAPRNSPKLWKGDAT